MKAKFEASFAGNPKPDIIWQFNGVDIVSSDRVKIKVRDTKTTLTIQDVSAADAGQYTLRVKNDLGSDVTRGGLTISSEFCTSGLSKDCSVAGFILVFYS